VFLEFPLIDFAKKEWFVGFSLLKANGDKNERSKCKLSLPKWLNFSAKQGTYLKRVAHEIRVIYGVWGSLICKNDR
jgi:hypothetical protein